MMALSAALLLTACEKAVMSEEQPTPSTNTQNGKKFTFTTKGNFSDESWKTRGYLSENAEQITDLWLLDYMDGNLVQQLHQVPTDDGWGRPAMTLAYGSHHIYFVASRGDSPVVNTELKTITWDTTRDTFWKDYEVDVKKTSNGNRAVTLDRVATKLKVTILDRVPDGAAKISLTPDEWWYGIDYTNGQPVARDKKERSVAIPSSLIGTEGSLTFSIFGMCTASEWTTDVVVRIYDTDGKVLGSATIENVPLKGGRSTEYSGSVFTEPLMAASTTISLNSDWPTAYIGTW